MRTNLFVSTMRTLTPLGVALVLSWSGRLGIPVDSEAAAAAVALGLAGAYYLVFRGLEWLAERLSWAPLRLAAGVLLGWARPPQYKQPTTGTRAVSIHLEPNDEEMREFLKRLTGRGGGAG